MRIKWFSLVRITGLLLVLLYHFFKTKFTGGFIGVDIFFTFSGYLITALLIDEYNRDKKIDLVGFYRRRFYRIVPPMVLMVLVVMPFTLLVRNDFRAMIGQQIAATIGFMTNIYEIVTGGNYESQFIPHLFVHTWSLAIEVHFYILWGLLVWLLARQQFSPNKFRSILFITSSTIFGLSFLSMFIGAFFVSNFSTLYFSSFSHSFPFFLGAVFATLTGIKTTTIRFKKNIQLWSKQRVLLLIAVSIFFLLILTFALDFNNIFTYLFGFVLASLFASTMIYGTRILSDQLPDVEEPKILTYIADISYGMYLFHWPFYIIFSQLVPNALAAFLTVLFSMFFSTLSFYVIEPYIAGKKVVVLDLEVDVSSYRKYLLGVGSFLLLILLIISFVSPKIGTFESDLLVGSLKQSQTKIERTHTLAAGDAKALSDIEVIGDSVALRSSNMFESLMPGTQLDAAVSRNFTDAFTIFKGQIKANNLSSTVVLAIGVNSLDNYKVDLQQFIDKLPKGHRLVIVSPYNSKNDYQVSLVRDYELTLSKKYKYVTIADWYKTAIENSEIWIGSDGVHYNNQTTKGAKLYVNTIKKAVQKSAKLPSKK